jgi:amidase
MDLSRTDAVGQAEAIRSGTISEHELLEATIERIDRVNPQLNAVIHTMYDKARASIDAGLPDGPFRGVPWLLKDLWAHSEGDPWHQGVRGLKNAGATATEDNHLVRRYREAGFVITGRTNTPELGMSASTESLAYGPSRNPWNLSHGTGGSSGGAAAAVAAGIVPAANASDGGGSIRIPAAMCGLFGLKPSRGRVPMGPHNDEWNTSVQHIVSHSVRDAAAILDISAIPMLSSGVVAPNFGLPYADTYRQNPGALRVGFVTTSHRDRIEVQPDVADATRKLAALLETMGHAVEESHPAAIARQQGGSPAVAAATAAWTIERVRERLGREVTEDDVEPGAWLMAQMDPGTGVDVLRSQHEAHLFRREMLSWWEGGFDILVTPTCAHTAPELGTVACTPENPMGALRGSVPYSMFTQMFNSTGQPAMSIPVGLDRNGLPIGVQLVAAYGREDQLLQLATQLEEELRWAETRAPMHP